jgi:hypothetical protein
MRRCEPATPVQWAAFVSDVGLEPAPEVPRDIRRPRELWRDYATAFADERGRELYTNVVVMDAARRAPEDPPTLYPSIPRADGRKRRCVRAPTGVSSSSAPPASQAPGFPAVIRCFLSEMLPHGCQPIGLLSADNWAGIGYLRPDMTPPADEVGALETHRRVIALERAGAGLLQLLLSVFAGRQARRILARDEAMDAETAFDFQGGVAGEGALYWVRGAAPRGEGPFHEMLCYLHANRAAALHRRYIVADDGAWGLPIVAMLDTLHAAKPDLGMADVTTAVHQMVQAHRAAALADTVRLVRYGSYMTHYCMRLQLILRQLLVGVPPTLAVARFPNDPEAGVLPVSIEQTAAMHHFSDETADLIVRLRLDVEQRNISQTLGRLRIPYSDALVYVHVVTHGIQLAMQRDGHLSNHTCFLPASPSMPGARAAAYMYAIAGPV